MVCPIKWTYKKVPDRIQDIKKTPGADPGVMFYNNLINAVM
jgi:hypothetical protein